MSNRVMTREAPHTLADLLIPENEDEFLKQVWSKKFLHIAGAAGRFDGLLTWHALNEILEHTFDNRRLRLYQNNQILDSTVYSTAEGLNHIALQQQLFHGATLVFDQIELL